MRSVRTDSDTNLTKLTVAFRSYAKEPKMDRAPGSVFVVSYIFFQFRLHMHDIFYRKLHISQKAFCQQHSQTHVTDSPDLTALYHRWRLMHILSQRNVKFQSIIGKVNIHHGRDFHDSLWVLEMSGFCST